MTDPIVQHIVTDVCANNGAVIQWACGVFGTVAGASVLANLRKYLPPWLGSVVDLVALNLVPKAVAQQQAEPPKGP